jgi:hypothetical protein
VSLWSTVSASRCERSYDLPKMDRVTGDEPAPARYLARLACCVCLAVLGLTLALAPSAQADAPFFTDDPVFSPGWEIKTGLAGEHNSHGSLLTEVLDWNYAPIARIRLNLTTTTRLLWRADTEAVFGFADTEFKVKWRFLDENANGGWPALGLAPKVFAPTADERRGLGDGAWRFQLPLVVGKFTGRWYHFGETGYQWVFSRSVSDITYGGAGTLYSFTDRFALGAEFFGSVPVDHTRDWQLLTTLGAVYTLNAHWQLKASVSRTLRDTARGGPNPAAVFLVVWNF